MSTMTIEQALGLAIQHHQAGRLAEAESIYRQILQQQPQHADALHLLGVLAGNARQVDAGAGLMRQAIALRPMEPLFRFNLAKLLAQAGQQRESLEAWRQMENLFPQNAEVPYELGNVLQVVGDSGRAMEAYRRAIALKPDYAEALNNLGVVLMAQRRVAEAEECFLRAVTAHPKQVEAYVNLGSACEARGEFEQAARWYEKILPTRPAHAGLYYNYGVALAALGRLEEAAAAYRRAAELKPDYFQAHNNLGSAYKNLCRLDDAAASYREALRVMPASADAHANLAGVYFVAGDHDQSLAFYRRAVEVNPAHAPAHSQMLYTLLFHPAYDGQMLRREHDRWDAIHAAPLRPSQIAHDNPCTAGDRRLRIGYVSSDFRDHVVGRNLVPMLEQHDSAAVEFFCYSNTSPRDGETPRFETLAQASGGWRDITRLSDEDAAKMIRRDQIDILVDLSLHMGGHRLLVFARKPSPVQMTFAGYPGTTGVKTMDYRLSDPYLDPPAGAGEREGWYSEQTIVMPQTFWCFDPLGIEPPVNPLPVESAAGGAITFGCLNNFAKTNPGTLALWAKVLGAVPNSRMVMLCPEGSPRARTLDLLASLGVARERVRFLAPRPRREYLLFYHQLDIGLDTLPYNGHSTSLDSYWMGVPVVTLVGKTVVGRAGLSQLTNLGLTELIAHTPEQFVEIACALAQDISRLRALRATLRERMKASPLMDAQAFARNIEGAYRQMWQKWCAKQVLSKGAG